jgi:hypothetical protein
MCKYQTLYYNRNAGQVIHCQQCNNLQVAFGNLALSLSYAEFRKFKKWIREIADEHMTQSGCSSHTIAVPTPCAGMKILLNPFEFDRLNSMLETADTEFQSLQLLNLFS